MKLFRAGCGREQPGPEELVDLAYLALEYPECPECPHHLRPEAGPDFCRWLALDRPQPFAALARLEVPE